MILLLPHRLGRYLSQTFQNSWSTMWIIKPKFRSINYPSPRRASLREV